MAFFDDPTCLAPARVQREDRPDGSFVLSHPEPLQPYDRCVGEWLEHWAAATPQAPAVAERDAAGDWRRLSWAELRARVGEVAQALIDRDLPAQRPVVVLSDNGIEHLVLMLACMHVGRPVCSVSSAYSRLSKDHARLRGILQLLQPAFIFAADEAAYCPAVAAAAPAGVPVAFALPRAAETGAVHQAFASLQPEDTAKYLLTSGSTGMPKVVINTHRMLCANQQMLAQAWPFLQREKPVLLDWLPWSHTFGGNHNLNLVLRHGGTLHIDEGRPAPGLIEKTVRNLREVRPNLYFNVPRGYDMLLPFLEADREFAADFFGALRMLFYAGAALPQASWDRLQQAAQGVRDEPLWFTTAWGSTETAPAVTSAHWRLDRAGCLGLPLPGCELKFVPNGQKLELRVRGEAVFPGYRDAPELTRAAFDDEGFYRIGDAGLLLDPARPERGVVFDGRVAEDFKLGSGTWVSVGSVRVQTVSALAPLAQDVVVTGHGRDEIGALVFLAAAARELAPEALRERIAAALGALRHQGGGSSRAPTRALCLPDAPQVDAGEITDKGYVNQRAVLDRRAAEVELLYRDPPDPRVILAA